MGSLEKKMNLVWQLTCVITNLKHLTLQNLSWNDAMWLVNSFFAEDLKSQMGHLNGLVPSWTNAMCLVKWLFCDHLKSQMEHLNGLSPSWIDAMFLVKFPFSEKFKHKWNTWMYFFHHEQIKCAESKSSFVNICNHN